MCPVCQSDAATNVRIESRRRKRSSPSLQNLKVEEALSQLKLTHRQLEKIRDRIHENLQSKLRNVVRKEPKVSMLPTYVTHLPDGTEKGTFLALDLGGANFRVVKVYLPGTSSVKAQVFSQVYIIPKHLLASTAEEFFDHIAKCVADSLDHHGLKDQKLPLGITFSFPCVQEDLHQSVLLRWTKGFNVSGVVGKDIVVLLQEAFKRIRDAGVKCAIDVLAVINDTVGTLMSCAYENQDCCIGMVVGNGTNACYMESRKDIEFFNKSEHYNSEDSGQMCINTEWGSLGEDGSLNDVKTCFDERVDGASTNPGFMIYEKMVGGLYLGEIVLQVMLHLIKEGTLLGGVLTNEICASNVFPSSFLAQIEEDKTPDITVCGQILNNLGYPSTTRTDRQTVKAICEVVSSRSAHLCAAGVSALIERIRSARRLRDEDGIKITVAVDGTLYKKHPTFRHILRTKVQELSPRVEVNFCISNDGSGKGAALVSAVKCKLLKAKKPSS